MKNILGETLTDDEYELYILLSNKFGITFIPPNIYLRYGKNKTAHLVLSNIETYKPGMCWHCHSREGKYESEMTLQQCGGRPYKEKVMLCYDCYCPK